MRKNKRQEEQLQKMSDFIKADLQDHRSRVAIAGTLGMSVATLDEWMKKNNLKDLYGEPI